MADNALKKDSFREDCPCTKEGCPNHGNCEACRERHSTVSGIHPLPYCERPENK